VDFPLAFSIASSGAALMNILIVAVGLGFVIFFHELGHFAVAKWCNVNVERFSIGFGPVLFSWQWGETEYALSLVPFGGYVKMLGQDDIDPSQLSSEEIALDPRSYSAKKVHQRMAIISAGVIMNVITGLMFFAVAFRLGVETSPAVIGNVQVGRPAWTAGIQHGDQITRINDAEIASFGDIMRGVALSRGVLTIEGIHQDGRTFKAVVQPDESGTRRMIGASPSEGLQLIQPPSKEIPLIFPGTPALKADPPFQPGDLIKKSGDQELKSFADLQKNLADHRAEPVDLWVQRQDQPDGNLVKITVAATPFRTLGLSMDTGEVSAVRKGSPAEMNGLLVGDRLTHVGELSVGKDINPLQLPDWFAQHQGEEVELRVSRQVTGNEPKEVNIQLIPDANSGWIEVPYFPNESVSIPAVGIAFHVVPTVLSVQEGSPAQKSGILVGERIKKMNLVLPDEAEPDRFVEKTIEIDFNDEEKNWPYAFWKLQECPTRIAELTVSNELGEERTVSLAPQESIDWFVPNTRGLRMAGMSINQKADSVAGALQMGFVHTKNSIQDIWLTLRNLFGGRLSVKELRGPLGIASVAYQIAEQGIAQFLVFLGFLSANLAVLNFLPIPVLDGGHMVFLIWEGVTRKKPSERVLIAATYCGMAFVLGLMMLVLYLDIFVHKLN